MSGLAQPELTDDGAAASARERLARRFEEATAAVARAAARPMAPETPDGGPPPAHAGGEFPPEAGIAHLTADGLGDHLHQSGCVKVPGLIPATGAQVFISGIDRAFDGCDRWMADPYSGELDPWFEPFIPPGGGALHLTRPWLRNGGGLFTGDSPRLANRWFELVHEIGLFDLIADHFGEAPVTSLDKCALRRIGRGDGDGIEWHQDGSFLGAENRAVNVWLSLSDTARSPGLEIVSRRFESIVETGTGGAGYDWSTGPEVVAELGRTNPVVQPHFAPGDALIFDGLLLHRTAQLDPPAPERRYAIETWFFRPSAFPSHQEIPLAI